MKGRFFFFIISLVATQISVANTTRLFNCQSNRFLRTSFELSVGSGGDWSMQEVTYPESCQLKSIIDHSSLTYKLRPVDPSLANCTLKNWSRPDTERQVIGIYVKSAFLEKGEGYVKLSLDNEFADYGPQRLTSFVYCREN